VLHGEAAGIQFPLTQEGLPLGLFAMPSMTIAWNFSATTVGWRYAFRLGAGKASIVSY